MEGHVLDVDRVIQRLEVIVEAGHHEVGVVGVADEAIRTGAHWHLIERCVTDALDMRLGEDRADGLRSWASGLRPRRRSAH